MHHKRGRVRYYQDGQRIKQRTPAGMLFWLLYLNWFGRFFRFFLVRGMANRVMRWWYTSRISRWRIRPFIKRHKVDPRQFAEPVSSFTNFNDFFIRRLKKDARPINKTAHSIVSPADGTAFLIPHLQSTNTFYVKDHPFNLPAFVGSTALAADYEQGVLAIIRLAPHDYHRFHMPVAGYVTDHGTLGRRYESVNPRAYRYAMPLLENHRHVFELQTAAKHRLLVVAVGALCVGSIVTTYNRGRNYLLKGSELGYFAFGGSTVAIIFPANSVQLRTDMLTYSAQGYETAIDMGLPLAQWR